MPAENLITCCALTTREIQTIFKLGKRAMRSQELDIIVRPSSFPYGRLLVVTSRKIGTAPWRNKARRRLKEIFRLNKLNERGFDCIIIMKKPGLSCGYDQLEQIVCGALRNYTI